MTHSVTHVPNVTTKRPNIHYPVTKRPNVVHSVTHVPNVTYTVHLPNITNKSITFK